MKSKTWLEIVLAQEWDLTFHRCMIQQVKRLAKFTTYKKHALAVRTKKLPGPLMSFAKKILLDGVPQQGA